MLDLLNHPLAGKFLDALIIPAILGFGAFVRWYIKERAIEKAKRRGEVVEARKTEKEYLEETIETLQQVQGSLTAQLLESGASNQRLTVRNGELAATIDQQRAAMETCLRAHRTERDQQDSRLDRLYDLARKIRHAGNDVYYMLKRGEEPKPGWLPILPPQEEI